MVIMASGIARGRVRTTAATTVESRNMAAMLQIILGFHQSVSKTKNRKHSMNRVKKLGYDRLINKQPRQESGLCCFSFARYLQSFVWGHHVCVLLRDTNLAAVK